MLIKSGHSVGLGDEDGFAPNLRLPEEALDVLVRAIEAAGYTAARDGVAIALDPAASQFRHRDGDYRIAGGHCDSAGLVARYAQLVRDYPIWSIEDGMGEDDPAGWRLLYAELGDRVQIMGDDLFVTNAALIADGARDAMANSALIKLNQVARSPRRCRRSGPAARTA